MYNPIDHESLKSDLKLPNLIVGIMLVMLVTYLVICFTLGAELQEPLPEITRVKIRTALYVVAIVSFPMTNLLRHIQLRLNQTMPLTRLAYRAEAKKRYLVTVIVSMTLMETIGAFGFVLFMLGDGRNNLIIFTALSVLGLFLYRPKLHEYSQIVDSLAIKNHE
ncbi:MAG: hypothetical protein LUO95_11775 [Methylococcaceae bacterium]|nr:hypothetical protein [Methylococcaceae bacterium]MDD1611233.1 hypothetical protein [Methylococcaceae bacterium]MDD1617425.1 hypothetical protein [Methylococcaceae bacterium]OYV15537.1 MAG: hypothetical protein CG439_2549 [Methylococcaceae bacterium NSP1-2]